MLSISPIGSLLLVWSVVGCYHHVQPPTIDVIAVEAERETRPLPRPDGRQRLANYLTKNPQFVGYIDDVVALLDAEHLVEQGRVSEGLQALKFVHRQLAIGSVMFRKHVVDRYLTVLIEQTTELRARSFFVEQLNELGYSQQESMAIVAEQLGLVDDDNNYPQPAEDLATLLQDDPTLKRTADTYCRAKKRADAWQGLLSSFPQEVKTYWRGLTSACLGNDAQALALQSRYLDEDGEQITRYPQFVLTAANGIIDLGRRLGKGRSWLADSYERLVSLWQGSLDIDKLHLSPASAVAEKIDSLLWAARYQALLGNYRRAIILARRALVDSRQQLATGKGSKSQLLEYIAESYHILAFRVAVERNNYRQAIIYGNDALQYKLNDDWRERFLWYNGLYHYLSANWQEAEGFWQKSLREFPESTITPRILFWLAMAGQRQDKDVDHFLVRLERDHPLSYYTIVALPQVSGRMPWYSGYRRSHLQQRITTNHNLDLSAYRRQDHQLARPLLRVEILIAARLFELAKVELRELETRLGKRSLADHRDLRLYVTRLYLAAHDYVRAIVSNGNIAGNDDSYWHKWPEQLLVSFPKPFNDLFKREAFTNDIPIELLLAISRQESAFQTQAESRAGARGLMQLLPATAKTIADNHELEFRGPASLAEPSTNIKLATLHLRQLLNRYDNDLVITAAAYNAGKEAVDMWLQRRNHSDQQIWIELIPFGETKNYVKNVQRNYLLYRFFTSHERAVAIRYPIPPIRSQVGFSAMQQPSTVGAATGT